MKRKTLTILLVLVVIFVILTTNSYKAYMTNTNLKDTAITFTKFLVEGNTKEAVALSVGSVKYNVATNIPQNNQYQYLTTDAQIETTNSNLAIVHVETTYRDSEDLNVSFYKMYLIKNKESFLIYKLEEETPILESKSSIKIDTEAFTPVFQSYLTGIEKQDYKAAGHLLVGKAKKIHNNSSEFLQKTQLIENITDLRAEPIFGGDKNAVLKFTYTNDSRPISTLVSFYKTIEGWRIYEISQV